MTLSQGLLVFLVRRETELADLHSEFHGMDVELLQRSLNVLVKKGKAQIFGSEDQQGVKFF